jgi:hypothetical protein
VLAVGRNLLANGRGRWLALGASVLLAAGMFYAQGGERRHRPENAAAPTSQAAAPSSSAKVAAPTEAELLAASAPVAGQGQDFQFALPPGIAPEGGLQIHTIWVARAIAVMFPEIKTIGGYRQDALRWHPEGLAIDVMIPDYHSDEGIALGNQIAGFALAMAKKWGVLHVIWRQGFYPAQAAPSWTANYGNETANHMDHVHIATDGGGYPTGKETYFLDSMRTG